MRCGTILPSSVRREVNLVRKRSRDTAFDRYPGSRRHFGIEAGLVSVLEHRPDDSEVIVVLNEEYRDPYDLKDEVRFVAASRGAGFAKSLDAGWRASHGSIIHVLGCGFEVTAGWADVAMRHFADPRVGAVAPLLVEVKESSTHRAGHARASGRPRVCAGGRRELALCGQDLRTAEFDSQSLLGPMGLAAFYSRAALDALEDPFTRAVGDQLLDIDLAWQLRRSGYAAVLEPASRIRGDEARLLVQHPVIGRRCMPSGCSGGNAPGESWPKALLAHVAAIARTRGRVFRRWRPFVNLSAARPGSWKSPHRRHYLKTQHLQLASVESSRALEHSRVDASHPSRKPRERFSSVAATPDRR